jgi:hypothetical protein
VQPTADATDTSFGLGRERRDLRESLGELLASGGIANCGEIFDRAPQSTGGHGPIRLVTRFAVRAGRGAATHAATADAAMASAATANAIR